MLQKKPKNSLQRLRNSFLVILIKIILDAAILTVSFGFAYWVRFRSNIFPILKGIPSFGGYYHAVPVMCLLVIFFMRGHRLYSDKRSHYEFDEFIDIIKSVTSAMLVLMAVTFLYREFSYSRGLIVIAWATNIMFLSLWRFVFSAVLDSISRLRGHTRRFLVIGTGEKGHAVAEKIRNSKRQGYKLVGLLSTDTSAHRHANDIKVLGSLENLKEIISKYKIDEVILAQTGLAHNKVADIIVECEKSMVTFKMMADLLGLMTSQIDAGTLYGVTLLGLKDSPLNSTANRFLKRCVDIFGSLSGLLLFAAPFMIIAILIKKDSNGPVFYRQERTGEDGRSFWIYKFRTMKKDAEKETGPVWAKENDSRRTQIGEFLRKYNIDELPQLINVLAGDMSLVGPRPERPHFVRQFREDIPRYMSRHKIKSGMTGWAAVNGLRGDTSIEERTKYDLYYIENWSLLFDLKIILMSLGKAAFKNAY